MWSPDGTRIAYDGPSSTAGAWQVVVVDPDGSTQDPGTTLRSAAPAASNGLPTVRKVTAYQDGPVVATRTPVARCWSSTCPGRRLS